MLVTDVVSFTDLLRTCGDEWGRSLMQEHDELLLRCFEAYGGRVVTPTGDGFLAAFDSVSSALSSAIDIHQALSSRPASSASPLLRLRAGVHAGEPLEYDDRLLGLCVNTCFRICKAARPGHILVSETVRSLAAGGGFGFRRTRAARLKGLRELMQLYDLQVPGRRSANTQLQPALFPRRIDECVPRLLPADKRMNLYTPQVRGSSELAQSAGGEAAASSAPS